MFNCGVATAQGTEQEALAVCRRPRGREVVFNRLFLCQVWTLGRTSDIISWLKPKIFSVITLSL